MKKYPLLLCSLLAIFISLQGCLRTIEVPVAGEASGTIIKVGASVRSGSTQTFTVDVHVVDPTGTFVNGLTKENFAIKDTSSNPVGVSFQLLGVKEGNKTAYKGDYSAALLLDQSGSIDGCQGERYTARCGDATDPNNLRIEASKIFIGALGRGDFVSLSSFAGDAQYYPNNFKVHHGFTQTTSSLYKTLDSLADKPYGGTPLYDASQKVISYTSISAPTNNKVLIVLTDGQSSGDYTSRSTVEYTANQKQIPVFTVGLSNNISVSELTQLATNTGGSFMWAKDAKQLISYFGTLGNLLRGNAEYYTLTFQANAISNFYTGATTLFLQVKLSNGKKILLPYIIRFSS